MGWWSRFREAVSGGGSQQQHAEFRAVTAGSVPWVSGGGVQSPVLTQERALALAPVFAAVRTLAQTISTLPLKPYRNVGDERQPMGSLPQLFEQLRVDGRLVRWVHECVVSMALRGNAVGLVTARDGFGFPTRVDWLNPADVFVDDYRSVIRPVWYWKGREVPREDIVHVPWFPVPGSVWGLSPIAQFALTIGTGLDAQSYGADWFRGGGFPPGTFVNEHQPVIEQDKAEEIKARVVSAIRTRQPLVHGSGWKYTPITVPPNEAQFIETMRLSATQIANIYGLPPEDIGGTTGSSLTYNTVELNQLSRLQSFRAWLVLLEHAFGSWLPDRQYVRFNADAVVRADVRTRWEVHRIAVELGARSLDEVRRLEDEPPLPYGRGQTFRDSQQVPSGTVEEMQPVDRAAGRNLRPA